MRTGKDYFKASGRLRAALLTSSALALAWALPAAPARAASNGTWLASPGSNDYGNGANWDGGFVPVGTASFGTSNTTSLVITSASVGGWTFNAGASNYTFDASGQLNFTGAGITVNGGSVTITAGAVHFQNSATAGNATINVNSSSDLSFSDNSTAGSAAINNNNSQVEFLQRGPSRPARSLATGYSTLGTANSRSAATIPRPRSAASSRAPAAHWSRSAPAR